MAKEFDQHRDFRAGKHNGFNMEWYDELRATKPNWTKVSEQRVHQNRGIPVPPEGITKTIKIKAGVLDMAVHLVSVTNIQRKGD